MKAVRLVAGSIAAVALSMLLAAPFAAPLFVFQPERLDSPDPGRWRVPAQAVTFAATDGSLLSGWWTPPPGAGAPVILFAHGRSGNIARRADIARRLVADGFGLLAFDYRGYGASTGRPSETAIGEDSVSAYDWLRARGIPAGRIVVIGQSLGNASAARLASLRPLAGLVLVSPFTSLPEAAADRYPWLPLRLLPWPRNRFEVAAHLRELRIPILLVVSRPDRLVPYRNARRLAASLTLRPQWIEEQRHGHDGLLRAALADGRLQAFVRAATADR